MRVLVAIATLLASSVVGLVGASPASAAVETCAPPHVHGVVVTAFHAVGIGCAEAEGPAIHTLRHGEPHGWTCARRTHLHDAGGGLYWLSFSWHCSKPGHTSYHIRFHHPR
ncbi:hypothetical protein [Nocardioides caricicola]|uniref:Secreted protein n=1 Tax=Nocardioides caricicola TaxID=634770 RepID=A0ABW0MZ09_9ACTN